MEQVKLIGAIYVEPLALHAPTTKETNFFEQEQKNRELKVAFSFFRRTTTSITTLAPQVIIISKEEEEEVEILSQPIVEKQLEQDHEPRPMEEGELQQPMSNDNGEEFFQELFEEPICSVIHQCPRLRTKATMKRKGKVHVKEQVEKLIKKKTTFKVKET